MEGDKTSKAKSKVNTRSGNYEKVTAESDDDANASSPSLAGLDHVEAGMLASIHAEIKAMHRHVKSELHSFWSTLRKDMKRELAEIRDEINQALGDVREP